MMERPRYEREIEELLAQLDDLPPGAPRGAKPPRKPRFTDRLVAFLGDVVRSVDSAKMAIVGVLLILVGALARNSIGPVSQVLIVTGAIVLVLAYVLYFTRQRSMRYRKRWRGEDIEFEREPTKLEQWVDHMLHRLRGKQ